MAVSIEVVHAVVRQMADTRQQWSAGLRAAGGGVWPPVAMDYLHHHVHTVERRVNFGMHERHGKLKHPVYTSWRAMRYRCASSNPCYGGRGIAVCEAWDSFPAFLEWALANGWRRGLSIDRIDPNKDYEPSNCRWATAKQQANNTRITTRVVVRGSEKSVLQWARDTGIPQATLYKRYHAGIRGAAFIAPPEPGKSHRLRAKIDKAKEQT